jgi:2-succinyl-6-hydroxy-2,4-cyclohexadiene-1-carboxylate synthase
VIGVRRFGSGPPLVALHGFSLTGEQFASASSTLGRTVIAPDLPGHGRNAAASTRLTDVIDLAASVVASVGAPVPVIGYSQGARIALLTALDRPAGMSGIVLVSANPGIDDTHERSARARSDTRLASRISKMTIDDFLDTWTTNGITSTTHLSIEDRRADNEIRRQNSPRGLARALTGYGQGAQPSVWRRLTDITMPVLIISGTRDEKYSAIAQRMAAIIPDAEILALDHAGHNPLGDTPDQAYGAISDFLDRHG